VSVKEESPTCESDIRLRVYEEAPGFRLGPHARVQNALDGKAGKNPPDPTRHSRGAGRLEALGAEAVREVWRLGLGPVTLITSV